MTELTITLLAIIAVCVFAEIKEDDAHEWVKRKEIDENHN
jgi:hypothetical protein